MSRCVACAEFLTSALIPTPYHTLPHPLVLPYYLPRTSHLPRIRSFGLPIRYSSPAAYRSILSHRHVLLITAYCSHLHAMYAPSYGGGFAPSNNSQPFNPNGGLQQPQNPHQQQQMGQPRQMMFNPQDYAAGPQPSPYASGNPGMSGNAGGMGMMQNSGLAHVPAGPSTFALISSFSYYYINFGRPRAARQQTIRTYHMGSLLITFKSHIIFARPRIRVK